MDDLTGKKSKSITVSLWDGKNIKESYILNKRYSDEEYEREIKKFVAKWCNEEKLLWEDELTISQYAEGNESFSLSTVYVHNSEFYIKLCQHLKNLNLQK